VTFRRLCPPVAGLIVALSLGVALSVGSAAASPRAFADQTFVDPAGDANGGPDVTAVTVSNDATGTVKMVVSVALPQSSLMLVGIDNNLDGSLERYMGAYSMGSGLLLQAASKTDPTFAFVPSLKLSGTETTATLSFAKDELAIGQTFNFVIGTAQSLEASDLSDFAGPYQYTLTTAPPPATTTSTTMTTTPPPAPAVIKPVIAAPVSTPTAPVAGKRMTVTFLVTRSDNGKPLTNGTMVCDPSVAGKVITHAESFKAGKATLSFVVPKSAKGKQLKVKVTITTGAQSASKIVTFRVR
jgi:hypothetical protein